MSKKKKNKAHLHKRVSPTKFIYFWVFVILLVIFLVILKTLGFEKNEQKVFKSDNPLVLNFGDVMFDRGVRNIMEKGRDPFEYIKKDINIIKNFDVVIANLEGPIVEMDRNLCQAKAYNFQFALNTPTLLKSAGINMVNIANNHFYDCYWTGYVSTKNSLQAAGIDYIGDFQLSNSFVVKNIKGKKVAFIGMDQTVQMTPIAKFYPIVKKLKSENDYVVVNIHWGTEYYLDATSIQRSIAHTLIDNGADVIFGAHPHVVEPVEIYKGKAIFYSLGNFVFDQTDIHTTDGLGVGVEFATDKNIFTLFPYNIKSFAPALLKGDELVKYCQNYLRNFLHNGCSLEIKNQIL